MDEERSILLDGPKPRKKLRRRCVRAVGVVLVLLIVGWVVIARSPVTRMILVPQIESYLSVIAEVDQIHIGLNGVVRVRGLRLTAPGFARAGQTPPEHARFFEIDEAQVYLDWGGIFSGSPRVDRVEVNGGLIRLSQSTQTSQLNVSGLALLSGSTSDKSLQLPQLIAEGFVFELGEHDAGGVYRKLRTLKVAGQLKPPTEDGVNAFELEQRAESVSWSSGQAVPIPMTSEFKISGRFGPDGVRGVVSGISLEEWRPEDFPGPIRSVLNQLNLAGQIQKVTGEIAPDGEFSLFMMVDGVGVTLPFSPGNGSEQQARLTDTSGVIHVDSDGLHADLAGELHGLSYAVDLDIFGFDTTAAFESTLTTNFHLENNLGVLVFAPEEVIEKLSWFGNPVADVEAEILIARAAAIDGVVPETSVSGTIRFANATSAYKNFVYPFQNISGQARFTADELIIEEISGVGPTGALMTASAIFAPLGETSEATIRVSATGIPLDQHLMDALSVGRREMVQQLFNEERYFELLDLGLVLLPEERERLESLSLNLHEQIGVLAKSDPERAKLQAQCDRIDLQLKTPAFTFGGKTDVELTIHRELGVESIWTKDIRVLLNRVGIVPKYFPLPLVAHDVRLRIDDTSVELTGGVFSGITGGHARVRTNIALVDAQGNSIPDALPTIHVEAHDFPIDPRLITAIPGYKGAEPGTGLRGIIDRLNLEGFINAVADIEPRENGELGFEIDVPVDRIVAMPQHAPNRADNHPGLRIEPTGGRLTAREDLVIVDLGGRLIDLAGELDPIEFDLLTEVNYVESRAGFSGTRRTRPSDRYGPPRPGPRLGVEAGVQGLALSLPVEDLAAIVSGSTADQLAQLRVQRRPEGRVDLEAVFEGHLNGAIEGLTEIHSGQALAINVGNTRVSVGELGGMIRLGSGAEPFIEFESVEGEIAVDGGASGAFEINGVLPQATAGLAPEKFHRAQPHLWDRGLTITLTGGAFESPLTGLTARSKLGASALEWFEDLRLHGGYSANLRIDPVRAPVDPSVFPGSAVMPPLAFSGVIEPRNAQFIYRGTPIEIETVSGIVGFDGAEGWVDRLIGETRDWLVELNGPWHVEPGYGFFLDTLMQVEAAVLDDQLNALIPIPVVEALNALEFDPGDGLVVRDLGLRIDFVADHELPQFDTEGTVVLNNASGRVGVGLLELAGEFAFQAENRSGRPTFSIELGLDRARAAGVRLVGITGRVHNDAGAGKMSVDELLAECHGGRLNGTIRTDLNKPMHPYEVDMRLTGARAAPVFADLSLGPDRMPNLEDVPATQLVEALAAERLAWANSGDRSRGILDGGVMLTGETLNKDAFHGRGRLGIRGGSIVAVPGLLPIIELSNLQMPSGSRLSRARAEFYMRGHTVYLDELSVSSDAIELYGKGTIGIPEVEIDLWMRSRALKKIPVISDLFEEIRDEIITATVKGKPGDIRISTEQFGGSKRVLNELLGNDSGPSRQRGEVGRGELESRPSPRPVPRSTGGLGSYSIAGPPAQQEEPSP